MATRTSANRPDYRSISAAVRYGTFSAFQGSPRRRLHRIVDLMRELRATQARRHVRAAVPFLAGPRVGVDQLIAGLA